MAYLALAVMLLWTAASALAVCPGMVRQARGVMAAAAVFTAIFAAAKLFSMGDGFSDITKAVCDGWRAAFGCAALLSAGGYIFAKRVEKRKRDTYSDIDENVNEQS